MQIKQHHQIKCFVIKTLDDLLQWLLFLNFKQIELKFNYANADSDDCNAIVTLIANATTNTLYCALNCTMMSA